MSSQSSSSSSTTATATTTLAGPSRLWNFFRKSIVSGPGNNSSENTLVPPTPQNTDIPSLPAAVYSPNNTTVIDEFFDARSNNPATASRTPSLASTLDPPPYAPYGHQVLETRPGVYAVQEPPTLARCFFLYGFIFFPFWILGILVLVSPLRPTPDWEEGKTEHEKEQLLIIIRNTEKKWARRCLYAFSTLVILIVLIAIIVSFAIHKSSP
ncbi:hypothetical protein Clacol_003846 [Clathrus columnatus]|uniref:Uncharacterized protein n=1 Tax=Clathrus columnatus TaxID=1419009 RepID=A0AAV5A8W3_9AGAM|nr:hypothetical protein Clacol_003846 [Clathrus columnatus]